MGRIQNNLRMVNREREMGLRRHKGTFAMCCFFPLKKKTQTTQKTDLTGIKPSIKVTVEVNAFCNFLFFSLVLFISLSNSA